MRKIKLLIDDFPYSSKPDEEMGYIKTRFKDPNALKEVTVEQLFDYIGKGHTICPAVLKGGVGNENWKHQELVGIDIDNKELGKLITVDEAISLLKSNNINILGYYHTFSSCEEKQKFRLLFLLKEPVYDDVKMKFIIDTLIDFISQSDKACNDLSRCFYGTNKTTKILDPNATITYEDIVRLSLFKYTGNSKDMISYAEWLCKKLDINIYKGKIYFKRGTRYISSKNLLLREANKHLPLKKNQDTELLHQIEKISYYYDDLTEDLFIQLNNGIIKDNEFILTDEINFSPYYLDINYDPNAYDVHVDNFLNDVSCNNLDRKKTLEEILGHILMLKEFPHKLFLIVGGGKNGKSAFVNLIKNFCGNLVSFVPLNKFSDDTSLKATIGMLVNISDDIDPDYLEKSEKLKLFASGNTTSLRPNYEDNISITNKATLIFTANKLPIFRDKSYGLNRRLCILEFRFKVETVIKDLDHKLSTDNAKSYILRLALVGLNRIIENGNQLSDFEYLQEMLDTYKKETDSIYAFISEYGNLHEKFYSYVYYDYVLFCSANGNDPLKSNVFSRSLKNYDYIVGKLQRYEGHKRVYAEDDNRDRQIFKIE